MAVNDVHGLQRRCYSLLWTPNAWNMSYTTTIAASLLGFHSKNRAPPAKNGSATATLTIKPERLAHLCVEEASLYPWMCFTSWFELHRSQDERFSAPSSVNFTRGHWPFCCVRQGRVRYDSCCTLNLLIKQTIHYTDKNYTNLFIILQSVNLKDIHRSMYAR